MNKSAIQTNTHKEDFTKELMGISAHDVGKEINFDENNMLTYEKDPSNQREVIADFDLIARKIANISSSRVTHGQLFKDDLESHAKKEKDKMKHPLDGLDDKYFISSEEAAKRAKESTRKYEEYMAQFPPIPPEEKYGHPLQRAKQALEAESDSPMSTYELFCHLGREVEMYEIPMALRNFAEEHGWEEVCRLCGITTHKNPR